MNLDVEALNNVNNIEACFLWHSNSNTVVMIPTSDLELRF